MKTVSSPEMVDSLINSLYQCFPEYSPSIVIPSILYILTTDESRSNIIASCNASKYSPPSIGSLNISPELKNRISRAYYISSVCASTNYRGQGLSKSVMILMLNDLISKGITSFILEVLPDNKIAYTLYQSLGFRKIASTNDNTNTYDLLFLSVV
jgi:RimJ/RimL family protein N-acetyltransferase